MKIKISSEEEKQRLDIFLSKKLPNLSRSQAQKSIKKGLISVNDKPASPHYKIRENDLVFVSSKKEEAKNSNKIFSAKEKKINLEKIIIHNHPDFLIINKPAGLIVHGADHIEEKTLADFLVEKYPDLKKIGEDPDRPAIVHRLDKEASGLMVIPKNQDFFDSLKKQFGKRTIKKEYTALVHGAIEKESDLIKFPIKKSAKGYKMAAVPEGYKNLPSSKFKAKIAITEFKVLEKFINFSLLKVKIKTGRTHQIRVHLFAYNHPLVGDKLYSIRKYEIQEKKVSLNRVFLVASSLSFLDLDDKVQKFEIDLPIELEKVLKIIK